MTFGQKCGFWLNYFRMSNNNDLQVPSMVTSKDKVDSVVHTVVTPSHMTEPETMFQWTATWTFSLNHSTLETTKPSLDLMLINLSLVVDSLSNGTQEECTNTISLMFSKPINSSLKKPTISSQKFNSTLKEVRWPEIFWHMNVGILWPKWLILTYSFRKESLWQTT